jgi:hypothetical protein
MLMRLYPSQFTEELGDSVDQAFRDMLRDAFRKRGRLGIVLLWFRVIPDFIYSTYELLTSSKGDYLKWYFKLRWVLACGFGFGFGFIVAASLRSMGLINGLALPSRWGLLGLPIWVGLGFFQSQVLTDRICHRLRWVALTVLGGIAGMLLVALFSVFLSPAMFGGIRMSSWQSVAAFPVLQIPYVFVGAMIGLLQPMASRKNCVPLRRWSASCALGSYLSVLLSFPVGTVIAYALLAVDLNPESIFRNWFFLNLVQNFIAGGLFGLVTADPLRRILWPLLNGPSTTVQSPAQDQEA